MSEEVRQERHINNPRDGDSPFLFPLRVFSFQLFQFIYSIKISYSQTLVQKSH